MFARIMADIRNRSRMRLKKNRHVHGRMETLEPRQLLALTIANLPAAEISSDAATIGIDVIETDQSDPTVTIYWGDEDGGTDLRAWDSNENLGTRPVGQHRAMLTGLTAGTEYFYRSFAFSFGDGGQVWTENAASFTTDALPASVLGLQPVSTVGDSSALVAGSIDAHGTLQAATIHYGTVDGGSDSAAWQQTLELPAVEGEFSAVVPNLLPNTQYFVRTSAANGGGVAWSDAESLVTSDAIPIRISEVMVANASTLPTRIRLAAEDSYEGPTNSRDWIEIQNSTSVDFDLGGYFLSDSVDSPLDWEVPAGTIVPSQGAIVIFASGLNVTDADLDERGFLHTNFSLSRGGETVLLTAPDGTEIHRVTVDPSMAVTDVSLGLFGDQFGPLAIPTPGESNGPLVPSVQPPTHVFSNPADAASSLVVTASIESTLADVSEVRLVHRVMFGDEQFVTMVDNATGGDAVAGDQIYTATIPGPIALPGEMLRYRIEVVDTVGSEVRMPRFLTDDNSPEYFGTLIDDPQIDTQVPVLHRFIEEDRRAETGSGTRASIAFNGEFYDNVFIRIRGGTARGWPKKAYKIEFNDDYHFRFQEDLPRVDEFNLNTTYTDKSYVRAILSYELYRDSGGIAPITFPMRVEQNGEFWNLAHFVEQPDRDYLRRNGLDPDGALYKAMADRLNGLTGRAEGFFDKKTRHAEDASDLQGLIDGLAVSGEELETFLFDQVDLAAQINLMASNLILQNLDATDKNYYIYRDTEGNQEWKMLPWDLDLVLGPNALNTDSFSTSDDDGPAHTSHPYMGTLAYPFHGRKNHLFDAVVNSPRTNQMFLRRVRTMMDTFMASADTPVEQRYFENRIDQLVQLLGPDVLLDKAAWERNTHFGGQTYTLEEAADRIKVDYLEPRRVHLFDTHNVSRLDIGDITLLVPEFSDNAEFFVPTNNDLGTSWTGRELPANAGEWQTGQLGIGFEERPDVFDELIKTRVRPLESCETCTSVFVRVPFSVADPSAVEDLTLQMKYDDGFVAYVNGVEVVRANTRDEVNGFDSRGRSHSDRLAVDFVNFHITDSIPDIDLGAENVLAIHLMNSSATSNDLLISPQLVDGFIPNTEAVGIPHAPIVAPAVVFRSFDQNPVSGNQDEEYLELHNPGSEAIDISGWQLQGGVTNRFRGGTVINAGESLFVTPNSLAFRNRATGPSGGQGLFVQDGIQGHLSNRGETIELVGLDGTVVASLTTPSIPSDVQQFLRVTELHYNPLGPSEDTEFVELRNTSESVTLDLNGVQITEGLGSSFAFAGSNVTTLAPGEFVLAVNDVSAFALAYPEADVSRIAGAYDGSLSNGGGEDQDRRRVERDRVGVQL